MWQNNELVQNVPKTKAMPPTKVKWVNKNKLLV